MLDTLAFTLIVLPFLAGLAIWVVRIGAVRSVVVLGTGALLMIASLLLAFQSAPWSYLPGTVLGLGVHSIIKFADFLLLFFYLYVGFRHKHKLVISMAVIQLVLLSFFYFFQIEHGHDHPTFYADNLALVMTLIICFVGSLICFYAIPYMNEHERHLGLTTSKQPRFFMVLIMLLGAMNGLVLTNDIIYFYFFFEVTTLSSFLLVGHDGDKVSTDNSLRVLWMNSVGGAFLLLGVIILYSQTQTLDLQALIKAAPAAQMLLLPVALFVAAGFVKSAQAPFQSWLLGAMVAPTPTSALLHSSTMVKAGVYLALRLSPAFAGTFLGASIALWGSFTFVTMAALAIGQSNGKKVLAYSTISNLGLIMACAGIATPAAITAGMLLIVFHAMSKALLFLCVGTVEQNIGSRDIEKMRGLATRFPALAMVTVIGVLTMILPPFGMLLGKWMAIESAAGNLFVICLLALGSALTVVYWARWAGVIMIEPLEGSEPGVEKHPMLTKAPLYVLCGGAVALSFLSPWVYSAGVLPQLGDIGDATPYVLSFGRFHGSGGGFAVMPLFVLAAIGVAFAMRSLRKARTGRRVGPYLCGAQTSEPGVFTGPMNVPVAAEASNYYLSKLFGEDRLTAWVNTGALLLIALMIGGTL